MRRLAWRRELVVWRGPEKQDCHPLYCFFPLDHHRTPSALLTDLTLSFSLLFSSLYFSLSLLDRVSGIFER